MIVCCCAIVQTVREVKIKFKISPFIFCFLIATNASALAVAVIEKLQLA